jgi:RNA polymerase sigma-70 factor (ECF subfamily)
MEEKLSQFEELLLPHLDGAYNVAYWLVQNDRDAQAIVEEAYVQARREFGRLRETQARVWLLTVVLRVTHSWIQQRDYGSKVVPFAPNGAPDAAVALADVAAEVPPDAQQSALAPSLFDALSRLPVESREILVLHEVEGWNYQQLAGSLGTTRDIITTRLSVARRGLRKGLGDVRSS